MSSATGQLAGEAERPQARIAALDALRGLAAFAIVVFHYVHFMPGGQRPYETPLYWLYARGYHAVALFFILSGYIFFATYADRIASGAMNPKQFFILRFSRLYPLHAITLFIVAIQQYVVLHEAGAFFVYDQNNPLLFLAGILLIHFGWFVTVPSFNGPSWSIAVEIYLYFCFFLFARQLAKNMPAQILAAYVPLALMLCDDFTATGPLNPYLCEGLGCFFLGGCLQAMSGLDRRLSILIGIAMMAAGAAATPICGPRLGLAGGIFPGLVLIACSSKLIVRASEWPLLRWLGDISYSTYLWHFPVQLAFVIFAALVAPIDYTAKPVFWLYVASVMLVGTLSFRFLETPARIAIRKWAARDRGAPARKQDLAPVSRGA